MKNTLNLQRIKESAIELSKVSEKQRNLFLTALGEILQQEQEKILAANTKDIKKAKAGNLSDSFIERLILDEKGIKQLTNKLKSIEKLSNSLGEIIEEKTVNNDLLIKKVRVPLGVIAVIYEARPEVTIDVAALCVKSGNVAILKGGSEALSTNKALYDCILLALGKSGLIKETISFIATNDRKVTHWLLKQHDFIDLVIARGGYGLVKTVVSNSTIPVLAHAAGGARMYVDKSADLSLATTIILNAKTSKPAACNSLDTLVVHKDIADKFIKQISKLLEEHHVKIINNDQQNWDTEFLELTMSIKVVSDVNEAVNFINKHSKRHSEAIIAKDKDVIESFVNSIDSAALFINCSTRLHDGYVFGLGSEMGISTGKLHARGPVGLKELTTYKWEIYGNGQIR